MILHINCMEFQVNDVQENLSIFLTHMKAERTMILKKFNLKNRYHNIPIRIRAAAMVSLLLSFCLLAGCIPSYTAENFDKYMDDLFCSEVAGNTINLHFNLQHPENYGITDAPVTLGSVSAADSIESASDSENILHLLNKYESAALTTDQRLTFDTLKDYLQTGLSLARYPYYDEILKPSTGIQAQLPILYEEYQFSGKKDVETYLTLLTQTKDYFRQIAVFEEEKAKEGLFMSDYACQTIISQCRDFVAGTEEIGTSTHYLIQTFNKKIDALTDLSAEEKNAYKQQNLTALEQFVFPAYEELADALSTLAGSGKNEYGLCYFADGKEFYEKLVYYNTGYTGSIQEIAADIDTQRSMDLLESARLSAVNENLWERCETAAVSDRDPAETLGVLKDTMLNDFPAPPKTHVTVSFIEKCMQEYVAPAFYITAPIDAAEKHSIYINATTDRTSLRYFTTLAHEGFPGHLYQTVMSYQASLPDIRFLLNYPGYVEGWATYVEMLSYQYAGLEPAVASLLSFNQSALLSLYASTDIGIHYEGWDFAQMKKFWNDYGISNETTLREIFELIVEEPAHYLKYYVGYLGFLQLKEYAMRTYGSNYSDIAFHQAVLAMGPAPFSILERYLPSYYENK